MWWLYFLLLFFSLLFPLLLSFEKNLRFYRRWKNLLPAIVIVAVIYIVIDFIFTKKGIWGFNPEYHAGLTLGGLPVEELLFFVVIPYASIFLHEALTFHFPQLQTGKTFSNLLPILLILLCLLLILLFPGKSYTVYSAILLILSLVAGLLDKSGILRKFFLTFVVILVPFLIVNGILTGTFIEGEVVWYNPEELLGIRILTIPVEDFGYGFSLILFDLLLSERWKRRFQTTKTKSR